MGDTPSKSEGDPQGRLPHMSSNTYQPWGSGPVDAWPHAAPPATPPMTYGGPTYGSPPPPGTGAVSNGWSHAPGSRGLVPAHPPPAGAYAGSGYGSSPSLGANGHQLPPPMGYGGPADAFGPRHGGPPSPAYSGSADWQQQPRAATPAPAPRPATIPMHPGQQHLQYSQVQLQDTLIVWDWDDTLMCSTAINTNSMSPSIVPVLEQLIDTALKVAMQCGETVIVTNADELWVIESARRFAPRALPLVQQLQDSGRVLSARRKYERACPGDVFAWKRETFREVVNAKRAAGGAASSGGVNLIALGDSPAEMEAAQTSTLDVRPLLIKTIKFKEAPTAEELVEELRMVCQDLPGIVSDDKPVSRNLAMFLRPSSPAQYAAPYAQSTYAATPAPYSGAYGGGCAAPLYSPPQTSYLGGGVAPAYSPPLAVYAGR